MAVLCKGPKAQCRELLVRHPTLPRVRGIKLGHLAYLRRPQIQIVNIDGQALGEQEERGVLGCVESQVGVTSHDEPEQ